MLLPLDTEPPTTFGFWDDLPVELQLEILSYRVVSSTAVGPADFHQFLIHMLLPLKMAGGPEIMAFVLEAYTRRNNFVLGLTSKGVFFPGPFDGVPAEGNTVPQECVLSLVLPIHISDHALRSPETFFRSVNKANILAHSKATASVPAKTQSKTAAQNKHTQAPKWLDSFPNLCKLEISIYIEPLLSPIRSQHGVPECLSDNYDIDSIAASLQDCKLTFELPDVRFKVLSEGCRTAHKAAPAHWRTIPRCEIRNAMVALGAAPCECEGKLRAAFRATLLEKK